MGIHTAIFKTERGHVIHRTDSGQELLGPRAAEITVSDEPDISPYPLFVGIELRYGRYEVTELRVLEAGPITVRGLQTIKFPEILRRGLRDEVTIRRTTDYGATVTGVGAEDEVPLVYLLARAIGDDPTAAVQEAFKKPTRQAAAQLVARARKAGHLPPTTKGAR